MRILIINGPNINLLGKREPSIYGSVSFEDYLGTLKALYPDVELDYFQSNVEGLSFIILSSKKFILLLPPLYDLQFLQKFFLITLS